ncbi:MAG: DUF2431 domain-containing protein [Deltaproteobacteria bacterium]|nr:DUF2431 domain-containing protein [Deltaproteobacteria bacterium]
MLADTTDYVYDARGRLDATTETHRRMSAGAPVTESLAVDYAYDADDNLACISSASAGCADTGSARTTQYGYDARGRLTTVQVQGDVSTAQYLPDGRVLNMQHSNGSRVDYIYHDQDPGSGEVHNRVYRVRHANGSGRIAEARYRYHANGTAREVMRWTQGTGSSTTTYDYDALGRVVDESEVAGTGTTHRTYNYGGGYNRMGEQVFSNGSLSEDFAYSYDDADRLLQFTDAVSGQQTGYTYDNNGNTLSRMVTGSPSSEVRYSYNALDQLVQVEQGVSPGTLLGQYDYDAGGLRIREWGPGGDRQRFYVAGRVHEETDMSGGGPTRLYRWAMGMHSLDVGSERGFYHTDALGTVMAVTDASSGLAGTWRTDTWGRVQPTAGNSATLGSQRHVFTSQVSDSSTGLVYMRGRYYDPSTGRFLTQDRASGSMSDPRSQHRYQYAHGNPVSHSDPSGMSTVFYGQHADGSAGSLAVGLSHQPLPVDFRGSPYDTGYASFEANIAQLDAEMAVFGAEVEYAAGEFERDTHHAWNDIPAYIDAFKEGAKQALIDGWEALKANPRAAIVEGLKIAGMVAFTVAAYTAAGIVAGPLGIMAVNAAFFGVDLLLLARDDKLTWGTAAMALGATLAMSGVSRVIGRVGGAMFRGAGRIMRAPARLLVSVAKAGAKFGSKAVSGVGSVLARVGKPVTQKLSWAAKKGMDLARTLNPKRLAGPGRNKVPSRGGGHGEAPRGRAQGDGGTPHPQGARCSTACFTGMTTVLTATAAVLLADVTVGMRVATAATQDASSAAQAELLSGTSVDETWQVVRLEFADPKRPGDVVEVELLRPQRWFAEYGVSSAGTQVQFPAKAVPGVQGLGTVVAIRPAPKVVDGPGRVVLMTLKHTDVEMYSLRVEETGETFAVTGSHPMWSLDREDWVAVRDLYVGEQLEGVAGGSGGRRVGWDAVDDGGGGAVEAEPPSTEGGGAAAWRQVRGLQVGARTESARRAVTIAALERIRDGAVVYDLEVEGDHEFLVGDVGLRAHNCGEQVLLVGEGNLSHARSLVEAGEVNPRQLVASVYERELLGDAASNAAWLRQQGATVRTGVDATDLASAFRGQTFGDIRFHFPHTGRDLASNRALLRGFFASAASHLSPSGTVSVTLKSGAYNWFGYLEGAAAAGLRRIRMQSWSSATYPGYST